MEEKWYYMPCKAVLRNREAPIWLTRRWSWGEVSIHLDSQLLSAMQNVILEESSSKPCKHTPQKKMKSLDHSLSFAHIQHPPAAHWSENERAMFSFTLLWSSDDPSSRYHLTARHCIVNHRLEPSHWEQSGPTEQGEEIKWLISKLAGFRSICMVCHGPSFPDIAEAVWLVYSLASRAASIAGRYSCPDTVPRRARKNDASLHIILRQDCFVAIAPWQLHWDFHHW